MSSDPTPITAETALNLALNQDVTLKFATPELARSFTRQCHGLRKKTRLENEARGLTSACEWDGIVISCPAGSQVVKMYFPRAIIELGESIND